MRRTAAVDRGRDDPHRRRARDDPRDRAATRSSPGSGSTPGDGRADRPRVLPLRRPADRSRRRMDPPTVRAALRGRASSTRAAPATTRASSSCTSRRSRHGWRPPAGCRSTCASSSRATRRSARSRSRGSSTSIRSCCRPTSASSPTATRFDDDGTPAIGYGLRGIAYWEVRVQGPAHDVHSGQYGGGVDNPANVLVRMLASLTDADGRFTVPGFYDRVRDLTDEERAAYAPCRSTRAPGATRPGSPQPMDGRARLHADRAPLRASDVRHPRHLGRLHRRGAEDDHPGLGGRQDQHPARARPGLPRDRAGREGAPRVDRPAERDRQVTVIHGGAPAITPLDHPGIGAGRAGPGGRLRQAPLFQRSGGSVPVVAALDAQLGLKTLMVGFANPTGQLPRPERVDERAQHPGRSRRSGAPVGRAGCHEGGRPARLTSLDVSRPIDIGRAPGGALAIDHHPGGTRRAPAHGSCMPARDGSPAVEPARSRVLA